jgi:hypothetical protein
LIQCVRPGHSAASRKDGKSKGKSQKAKIKNVCAGPWAGLGRDHRGLAAIKTIVASLLCAQRRIDAARVDAIAEAQLKRGDLAGKLFTVGPVTESVTASCVLVS